MSLSAAAISKNHDALAKLISSWVESNPLVEAEDAKEEGVVTIALRTRPFLESEGKDLLSGVHARGRKMWVHVPSSKWSGPTIQHKPFEGDFAFGPESTSEEVYERLVVRPGVLDTVLGGGVGCILAYGQTGSGKNTLTYVSPFRVTTTSQSAASSETSPAAWSNEEFRAWVAKTSSKIDPAKLAPFESGKQMCELDEGVFIQRCLDSQKDGLDKPLTEAGAKAFYDKLWGMVATGALSTWAVEAKQNSRPEELRTLTYNPPSMWSHFQVRDYIEKEIPAVDLDKLMPTMVLNPRRGKDFIQDMGEAEFILTLTSSNKDGETVSVEDAKGLHTKLWKIENDTWNASRTETLAQRDPNGGTGTYEAFDEERLNDPAIYALIYGSQPPS
ncbi:hypothetical protein FRC11_010065 [Ceratobasidium sp. 423]|nr:hypothetical protein FRC11_010065 [Ceratobasidium sp. 423]